MVIRGGATSADEFRPHSGLTEIYRAVGKIRVRIICPFCAANVEAFLWSLAGSGKKCSCGAVCGQHGAWKKKDARDGVRMDATGGPCPACKGERDGLRS